jgi:hypothetical protein
MTLKVSDKTHLRVGTFSELPTDPVAVVLPVVVILPVSVILSEAKNLGVTLRFFASLRMTATG